VPLSEGGVQLEWHTSSLDIEAMFSDEGDEVSVDDHTAHTEWEGEVEESFHLLRPVLPSLRISR
jgi:hypothetical protein